MKSIMKLIGLLLMLGAPIITFSQVGLLGSWKYVSQSGEMTMQINTSTIVINNQSFPYKAQGNVLMIKDGAADTPYPYMLDGDKLTLEFPGGMEVLFTRIAASEAPQGQLPQSRSKPSSGTGQGQLSSTLSGKWLFQNQQGQLVLEFISANQLSFNGETTQYQLKEGIIQAKGDYGWIDYPYNLSQGILTITFPDGSSLPFTSSSSPSSNQQPLNKEGSKQQATGGGPAWQLKGSLCSWSGSSNSSSSFSRTQKIVFDGQGNFQIGSESSFSSNSGIAYGGNPSIETGTYGVGESTVTLRYRSGETYVFKINMRQDNGIITELMYSGTLYAKGLCN
jgi:hypothetical protein